MVKTTLLIRTAILFYLLSIVQADFLLAQNRDFVPTTPEAATFSKIVHNSLRANTGIPDIDVPLYEVVSGSLKLPIGLRYDASGFVINSQSGRLGLGWELTAELQITREINGKSDFSGYLNDVKGGYRGAIDDNIAHDITRMAFANGTSDGMPDKFTYRLLNKSGSFYFKPNSSGTSFTIVPVPYSNIKIDFLNVNSSGATVWDGMFVIVDTDGTTYYFGRQAFDQSPAMIEQTSNENTYTQMSWKCVRIEGQNKSDYINFSYVPKQPVQTSRARSSIELYYTPDAYLDVDFSTSDHIKFASTDVNGATIMMNGKLFALSTFRYRIDIGGEFKSYLHVPYLDAHNNAVDKKFEYPSSLLSSHTIGSIVKGYALSEIQYRGGRIRFEGADKLTGITIENERQELIRNISFFQSYTAPPFLEDAKKYNGLNFQGTLYLDSLHVSQGNTQRYGFIYNDKFCFGNHLKGSDAWGYVNDFTVPLSYVGSWTELPIVDYILPTYKHASNMVYTIFNTPFHIGKDDWSEAPLESGMLKGVLKRIIYPTGGRVDYDFEAHRYNSASGPQLGGGLRIRSISHLDGEPTVLKTQKYYRYGEREDGIGKMPVEPPQNLANNKYSLAPFLLEWEVHHFAPPVHEDFPTSYNPNGPRVIEYVKRYEPASSLNYSYANGSSAYYTKITEYNSDMGSLSGRRVYRFYPENEFVQGSWMLGNSNYISGTNIPLLKVSGYRGILKSVTDYGYNGKFFPLQKTEHTYQVFSQSEQVKVIYSFLKQRIAVYGLNQSSSQEFETGFYSDASRFRAGTYGLPVFSLLKKSETKVFYSGTDSLTESTNYEYGKLPYLNPTKQIKSTANGIVETSFKYCYDFAGNISLDQMKAHNILDYPIETIAHNTSKNVQLSRKEYRYTFLTDRKLARLNQIVESVKGGPLQTLVSFDRYDNYNNVTQLTEKGGQVYSYIWGYQGTVPVAELRGVGYDNTLAHFSQSIVNSPVSEEQLLTTLKPLQSIFPTAMVRLFSHRTNVGLSSILDENGIGTRFGYTGMGRLGQIEDHRGFLKAAYDYNERAWFMYNMEALERANIPVLTHINYECSPGVKQLYSYIIPGGKYTKTSLDRDGANLDASFEARATFVPDPATIRPCSEGFTNWFQIEFWPVFDGSRAAPSELVVDFIQNDEIVFSRVLNIYSLPPSGAPKFYLPAGKYTVNFRPSANVRYKNYPNALKYRFFKISEGMLNSPFNSGGEISFEAGKMYMIDVTN